MAPLLPSGIPASSISGLVGVTCSALPAGAQPNAWFVSTKFMNDSKIKPFLFLLALTYLSAAQTIPMVSDRLYDDILCPLIFFGNVKAMPFPSVATGLTLARES